MQIYPIDPYQAKVLDKLQSNDNVFVKGGLGSGKAYTIVNAFLNYALDGKSSVLIVNTEQELLKFEELISQFHLHNSSLFFGTTKLAHSDLVKIKSNYSFDSNTDNIAGIEVLKKRLKYCKSEIINSYHNFYNNVFGEMNLPQVIELYDYFHIAHNSSFLETYLNNEDFELNEIEFVEIKNAIGKCKQIFQKEYLEFEANNLFSPNIFNQKFDENNIKNIRGQFRDLYMELQGLRNQYIDYFASYKKNHALKWKNQFNTLNKLRKEIFYKIEEVEFVGKLRDNYSGSIGTQFTKEKNLLASKYDELHALFVDFRQRLIKFRIFEGLPDLSKKETLPLPVIRDFMKSQEANFLNWKSIINRNVEENVKRLNKHNAEDLQLNNLESKLNFLVDRINSHNLFEEIFEDNALSSFKKFNFLEYLIQQIEFAFFQLQKLPGYYGWQHFWQTLKPGARKVINHLVKIDKKLWLSSYQSWYLKNIIEKNSQSDNPSNSHYFKDYFHQQEKFKDSIENLIHLLWQDKRSKNYEQLKLSDKTLFNAIFKKNVELNWTWQTMLAKQPDMLINAFPVTIIKKDDILNLNAPLVNKWDYVFSYEVDYDSKTEINIIRNLAKNFAHFSKHDPSPELKKVIYKDLKSKETPDTLELKVVHCNSSTKLINLPLRKRLKLAKQLASMLVHCNENIRIFHLKNANFISTLSKEANEKLILSFDENGIKESKMHGEIEAGIVEVLLDTDKKSVLFIQNGLINPQTPQSFDFQSSVLKFFNQAGISEMNIWSLDLLSNPGSMFDLAKDFINTASKKTEDTIAV